MQSDHEFEGKTHIKMQTDPKPSAMHQSNDFFSTYLTKFDAKITKMKQNYLANMIMNVSGTVCQLILYFPSKQGLAINFPWLALKSKQSMYIEPFDIISFNYCGGRGGVIYFIVTSTI